MGMEWVVNGVLVGLLIIQQVFYYWHTQKLVNKIMSRSYHEYVAATTPPRPRVALVNTEIEEDLKPINALNDFTL